MVMAVCVCVCVSLSLCVGIIAREWDCPRLNYSKIQKYDFLVIEYMYSLVPPSDCSSFLIALKKLFSRHQNQLFLLFFLSNVTFF